MALSDYKITEAQINQYGVISAPDILTGTADENKAVFDKLIRQIVANAVNNLIDALSNSGAASELPINPIEGLDAETVQQAITEINNNLADYIAKIKGTGGAAQVGVSAISGMTAQNAQAALSELKALIDDLVIGALPPGSVTADMIADDAIVQLGALLAVAAAGAYDPEGSYAVGDYCTHGGKLHKCGTAIPDGEAWNAEHWTATTVAEELTAIRAELAGKADNIATQEYALPLKEGYTAGIDGTGFSKTQDIVCLYFSVSGNFFASASDLGGGIFAALPEGYRPKGQVPVSVVHQDVGGPDWVKVLVQSDGTLRYYGNGPATFLCGAVAFRAN